MYEHMCIYRRCAACSELRNVRVSVHCGVHAIVRNVLKHVQVVRKDVRSLPYPFVYRKKFVNMRCRIHSLYKKKQDKAHSHSSVRVVNVEVSENGHVVIGVRIVQCYHAHGCRHWCPHNAMLPRYHRQF